MSLTWANSFDGGTIAWFALSLVAVLLLYVPGWLILYSGLIERSRCQALADAWFELATSLSLVWVLWGYSLAFAPSAFRTPVDASLAIVHTDIRDAMAAQDSQTDRSAEIGRGGVIGNCQYCGLHGLAPEGSGDKLVFPVRRTHPGVPHTLFFLHQLGVHLACAMAAVVPLIGTVRRIGVVLFAAIWSAAVYAPVAHGLWGEGWLWALGAIDRGGGLLVLATATSTVTASLLRGRRRRRSDHPSETLTEVEPVQERLVALGGVLVLVGSWFVHGSVHPDGTTALVILNKFIAALAGSVSWFGTARFVRQSVSPMAFALGSLTGLVAVSAGCGAIVPQSAFVLGMTGGSVGALLYHWRGIGPASRAVRVWTVLAVSSTIGLLGTGVFAVSTFSAGAERTTPGWIESGSFRLLWLELLAGSTVVGWSALVTLVLGGLTVQFCSRHQTDESALGASETA